MVLVAKRKYFTTQWKLNFSLSEFSSMKVFHSWKTKLYTCMTTLDLRFFDHPATLPSNQALIPGKVCSTVLWVIPCQNKNGGSSAVQCCFWNQRNPLNSRSGDKTFWWSIRIYQQSIRNVLGWGILPKDSTVYRSFWGKFCSWRGSDAHSLENRPTIDRERWDLSMWLNVPVLISSTVREP